MQWVNNSVGLCLSYWPVSFVQCDNSVQGLRVDSVATIIAYLSVSVVTDHLLIT